MKKIELLLVVFLIFLGIYYRLIPHSPNFSPLIAITVFSGFILSRKTNLLVSLFLPLAILFSTDLIIGLHKTIPFVYGGFLLSVILSFAYSHTFLKNKLEFKGSIIHSNISGFINNVVFYVISNFGVCLMGSLYSKDLNGLLECYVAAIPFFKNSVLATILFTTIIFGIYNLIVQWQDKKYRDYEKV